MERCKNCLYWQQKTEANSDQEWGECERTKTMYGDASDLTTNAWCYVYDGIGTGVLTTQEDFGCIQFKNRKLAVLK